ISQSQDLLVGGEGIDRAIIGIDLADLSPTNGRVRQDIVDLQTLSKELRAGSIESGSVLSRRNGDGQFVFENLGVTLGSIERIDIKGPVYVQAQRGGQAGAPIFPLSLFSSVQQVERSVSQIVIGGVPSGVTLSGSPRGSDGRYSIRPDALSGLRLNTGLPQPDFTLQVTAISQDGTASTSGVDLPVVVSQIIPPSISATIGVAEEDRSLALSVSVGLGDTDDVLSHVEIIIPDGTRLNRGILGSNGRWTLTGSEYQFFGQNLKLTPPPHFGGQLTLSVLAVASDPPEQSIGRVAVSGFVRPISDTAILVSSNAGGFEDRAISLLIESRLADTDGSETLVVYIGSVPTGVSLSSGTLSSGIWTLQQNQLLGLRLTPNIHSSDDFTLQVTSLTSEVGGFGTAITRSSLGVNVFGVADTALLSAQDVNAIEDFGAAFDISSALKDTDGSETLVVYIRGAPTGVSLSSGTLSSGIWTLQQSQLRGLKLTSSAHSSDDFTLSVISLTSESDSGLSVMRSQSVTVGVESLADSARLIVSNISSVEDRSILLNISSGLKDTDGSETLQIQIGNLPNGVSLSSGHFSNGLWTLNRLQLAGLKFTPLVHSDLDYTLKITAYSSENDRASLAVTSSTMVISVSAVADTADIKVGAISAKEDQSVFLRISASLADTDGSETFLVYISNIPTGVNISAGKFSGSQWTLQQSQLSGLKITPTAHSNQDFTLSVTTLSSESGSSSTQLSSFALPINISGVADTARVSFNNISIVEGLTQPLELSIGLIDTDGSETGLIYISDVPSNFSLSRGTLSG
ncbi:MAG: hypothetical protein AAF403_05860, partial [Pseudomonadota bacterium]